MVLKAGIGDDARNYVYMKFGTAYSAQQMAVFLNTMRIDGLGIKFTADKSGDYLCVFGASEIGEFYRNFISFTEHFNSIRIEETAGVAEPMEEARKTVIWNRLEHPRVNKAGQQGSDINPKTQ